jgi:hypothetical protein
MFVINVCKPNNNSDFINRNQYLALFIFYNENQPGRWYHHVCLSLSPTASDTDQMGSGGSAFELY